MKKVGIRELRATISRILEEKREVCITKNGKEIGYIVYTKPRGGVKSNTGKTKKAKVCTHGVLLSVGSCKHGC